jgi:hypothetical protein
MPTPRDPRDSNEQPTPRRLGQRRVHRLLSAMAKRHVLAALTTTALTAAARKTCLENL